MYTEILSKYITKSYGMNLTVINPVKYANSND